MVGLQGEERVFTRAFEAGRVDTLDLHRPHSGGPGTQPSVRSTTFHGWREENGDGTVVTRSGPPPRTWDCPDEPRVVAGREPGETAESLIPDLLAFADAVGAPMTLRYSHLRTCRVVLTPSGAWRSRETDAFALTGRIQLANGRMMSLGWSGAGDGRERLVEGPLRARLSWIAKTAGDAEPLSPGTGAAVLDPQPAALVAHEAVGHFCEAAADPAVDLRHRIGCRLAGDDFEAFDDPTFGGAVHYDVDDEGSEVLGATRILADGLVVEQLHSRRTAKAAETLPTANARAAQITLPPIPRLSNLIIPAGDSSRDAMIEEMGTGLLVHHLSHGFSRGIEIEARLVLAEVVERGRRTGRYVTGGRILERIDLLTRCHSRSDRGELNPNALCGKYGQILYDVGTIAPALSLTSLRTAP